MSFETNLLDGQVIELFADSGSTSITEDNVEEYIRLATDRKLMSCTRQMQHVITGLSQVVPMHLLRIFSWNELNQLVCGTPDFDVELLRQNATVDSSLAKAPALTHFWNCLRNFTALERSKFLRFAWGQSSLPQFGSESWRNINLATLSSPSPNTTYPKSSTCFFKCYLPLYTTEEACRTQLLYAINNCISIDSDGNPQMAQVAAEDDPFSGLFD